MQNFRTLPTDQLLELISTYTIDCARMIKQGASKEERSNCENMLILLQEEVKFRQPTLSSTDIKFEEGT